ncbi:MAG: triose-phosphate isomerase [bacterium]|nr:triose-phosphate isomerase [bacterium]
MPRTPLIAGNWKMFKTAGETIKLINALKEGTTDVEGVEVLVCPPLTALGVAVAALEGSNIKLGAQNMYFEPEGPYTGEISAKMLLDLGVEYVIVGHSERRAHFHDSDDIVNKKIHAALDNGLKPILCIGETLEEREEGLGGYTYEAEMGGYGKAKLQLEVKESWEEVLQRQITKGTDGLTEEQAAELTIAYEPVWAIGTGRTATPEIAEEAHALVRHTVGDLFGADIAKGMRILYGGSVKPDNVKTLMAEKDIDGALVGGAALKSETFLPIIKLGE